MSADGDWGETSLYDLCGNRTSLSLLSYPDSMCRSLCEMQLNQTWNSLLAREVVNLSSCVPRTTYPETFGPDKISTMRIVLRWMHVYITPIIIVVGILGNVLSCVVLLGTHLRRQSSSVYLACLSIADTGFLMTLFIAWLAWVNVNVINKQGWCQLTVFLAYVSAFLSVWSVVSFTAERYIAVWHPFHRHIMCSAKRAKILVVCLTVIGFLIYSPSLWTSTIVEMLGTHVCSPDPDLISVANAMMNVDTVITLVIPALIIIPLNICIVIKIYRTLQEHAALHEEDTPQGDAFCSQSAKLRTPSNSHSQSQSHSHSHSHSHSRTPSVDNDSHSVGEVTGNSERIANGNGHLQQDYLCNNNNRGHTGHRLGSVSGHHGRGLTRGDTCHSSLSGKQSEGSFARRATTNAALKRRSHSQMKTTRTLVFISSIFVLLNAPSHIFRINAFIVSMRGDHYRATDANLRGHEAAQLLYYVNFSINFFLYSACAQRFRKTLKRMLKRLRYSIACCHCDGSIPYTCTCPMPCSGPRMADNRSSFLSMPQTNPHKTPEPNGVRSPHPQTAL